MTGKLYATKWVFEMLSTTVLVLQKSLILCSDLTYSRVVSENPNGMKSRYKLEIK